MAKEKILSIFIPSYNRAMLLRRCLNSIIVDNEDVFEQIEIHISNNSPLDENYKAIEGFCKVHDNIFYHKNLETIGMDKNHDLMYDYCETKYCLALADDDIVIKGKLNILLDFCKRNEFVFAICNSCQHFYGIVQKEKLFDIHENLCYDGFNMLNVFLDERLPNALVPLLPYWGGVIVNVEYMRWNTSKKIRSIFDGTMHQYIGALWNALLSDKEAYAFLLEPVIVAIGMKEKKTWAEDAEELFKKKILLFYEKLDISDKMKQRILDIYGLKQWF